MKGLYFGSSQSAGSKNRVLLLFFLSFVVFVSCYNSTYKEIIKHYKESDFRYVDSIWTMRHPESAINYIDSVYETFGQVSVADKCRYYLFRIKLEDFHFNNVANTYSALLYTDSIISLIEENDLIKKMPDEYVQAYQLQGEFYLFQKKYTKAFNAISICRFLSRQGGDSCTAGENSASLGLIAFKQANYRQAAVYFKEAVALFPYCKDEIQIFYRMQNNLDNIAVSYAESKMLDSAFKYYRIAEEYINQNKHIYTKDPVFPLVALTVVYENMANAYRLNKQYDSAEHLMKKTLSLLENEIHDSLEVAKAQSQFAELYADMGEIAKADETVKKAEKLFPLFDGDNQQLFLKQKWRIAAAKSDIKAEIKNLSRYYSYKDSLSQVKKDLLKMNPAAEYDRLARNYQLGILQEKDKRNNIYLVTGSTIGLLLLVIALIIFLSLKKSRRLVAALETLNRDLVKKEKQLKVLMVEREMQERQKREEELFFQEVRLQMKHNDDIIDQRKRISEDLHDDLSGSLAALKFYIEDITNKADTLQTKQTLEAVGGEVKSIYENARSYMHSLWENVDVSQYDLLLFLQEISKKFSDKSSLNIIVDVDSENLTRSLSMHQHDQLFHIINECISNTIKHAEASQLRIGIGFENNLCHFTLQDDGKGFRSDETSSFGLGIKNMSKRVHDLNGKLDVQSDKSGTLIKGEFPVDNV